MSPNDPEGLPVVEFTVKELLHDLAGKIDKLADKLDDRLTKIESRVDAIELRATQRQHLEPDYDHLLARVVVLESESSFFRGGKKASWAIVGLLLSIAALILPLVIHIVVMND